MDKIELIFNMYKRVNICSKKFRREVISKYKITEEQARDLFIRIHNYQVDNFGGRLSIGERGFGALEKEIVNRNSRQRKYEKRVRRWEEQVRN